MDSTLKGRVDNHAYISRQQSPLNNAADNVEQVGTGKVIEKGRMSTFRGIRAPAGTPSITLDQPSNNAIRLEQTLLD